MSQNQLTKEARLLGKDERASILKGMKETDLHHALAALFRAMSADYWVEVTHGSDEYGKDLVIVRHDPLMPDVIGVVVKRGDIKGKTMGDVDDLKETVSEVLTAKGEKITREILSQIGQAKDFEATLKAFVKKLSVNRVMVVLAGEMSNNARARIDKEVGAMGAIVDLPWLVDMFTDHYPQVFFEARTLDFLYERIKTLEADNFHAKSDKNLSECFVEPVIAAMDKELSIDDATHLVEVKKRRIRYAELPKTIEAKHKVLLVGDPGSGKSKVAAKICIDGYRSALRDLGRPDAQGQIVGVPIVVPARLLRQMDTSDRLLDETLPDSVRSRLQASALVLDGLDEVPGDEREGILSKAERFADELKCNLLVTSRKLTTLQTAPPGFSRYEILPFEVGQAMKLVQKVLTNKEVLPALKEGIQKIQEQLPMSPLSLLLLIEVVAERKEVPASITELYERFLDLVFGRWDQEKGLEVVFEYVIKKRFLAALAFKEFYEKGRLEIPAAEFNAFLNAYAKEYGWDETKLGEFLKEVERAGILDTQEDVFFRHRSFLDYFVGLFIWEQREKFDDLTGLATKVYFDQLWSEAAFFFTGLGREISEDFLDAVFKYSVEGQEFPSEKLMVGRLLQAGWHSPAKVRERGLALALDQLPASVAQVRDHFLSLSKGKVPSFFADLFVMVMADSALSSVAIQQEASALMQKLQAENDPTPESFIKRAAMLWISRRFLTSAEHGAVIRQFIKDVEAAELGPVEEAKFVLMAGLADPAGIDIRKLIGKRIRRLEEKTPQAISAIIPKRRPRFRPPPKKR